MRLGYKGGVQKEEPDHDLDGAIAPQRGDDIAAQRLPKGPARPADVAGPVPGTREAPPSAGLAAVIAQSGGNLAGSHFDPAWNPHRQPGTGQRDRDDDKQRAGPVEEVGEGILDSTGDTAADDRAAQQTE